MVNINMNRAAGARASASVLTAAMVRKTEDMVSVAKENTIKVKNAPGVRRRLAMK